jgi:hypothetical protein
LLSLASLTGRPVHLVSTDGVGRRLGRLRDLVVDVSDSPVRVTAAVLGAFRTRWSVPWPQVVMGQSHSLQVHEDGAAHEPPLLGPHELLLVRDVLDTRVYEPEGRRSVRVGDVWLEPLPDGSMAVAGLEVGPEVMFRRLGLGRSRPGTGDLLPLSRVHLTSANGHRVQLATPTSSVHTLSGEDLAHLLTHLPVAAAADVVRQLPDRAVAQAVDHLHPHVVSRLRHALGGMVEPGRRFTRTAGWRLYRPRAAAEDADRARRPGSHHP